MTSSKPHHLRRLHLQIPSQWELGLQPMNWGGGTDIQFNNNQGSSNYKFCGIGSLVLRAVEALEKPVKV